MFERGEHDKDENMTAEFMAVDLQRIYPDDYTLPQFHAINSYVIHEMNKKRARVIIDFD